MASVLESNDFYRVLHSHWSGCNFIPEDLHPKSFRSAIGHNTNVFAVREVRDMPIGPPVGVFTPEQVPSLGV
jgi:hypothetical protein